MTLRLTNQGKAILTTFSVQSHEVVKIP